MHLNSIYRNNIYVNIVKYLSGNALVDHNVGEKFQLAPLIEPVSMT